MKASRLGPFGGVLVCSLLFAGCGSDGSDLAAQACAPTDAPSVGFNPETAPLSELERNAVAARERAALADQAAQADDEWRNLADAAAALASFAEVLRDARMDDVPVADVTTPAMWDQAKYASDAFLLECRKVAP